MDTRSQSGFDTATENTFKVPANRDLRRYDRDHCKVSVGSAVPTPATAGATQNDGSQLAKVGRFVGSVIHEVRNPLGAALANTQLALQHADDTVSLRVLNYLQRSVADMRRVAELVGHLHVLVTDPNYCALVFDFNRVTIAVAAVTASDAHRASCNVLVRGHNQPLPVDGDALGMILALSEVVWDAIDHGARCVHLEMERANDLAILTVRISGTTLGDSTYESLCQFVQSQGGRVEVLPGEPGSCNLRISLEIQNASAG